MPYPAGVVYDDEEDAVAAIPARDGSMLKSEQREIMRRKVVKTLGNELGYAKDNGSILR